MRIDVSGLRREKDAEEAYDLRSEVPPVEHLGRRITFDQPAEFHVVLRRTPRGITAHVEADLNGRLDCDRCLAPFNWPVHLAYDEEYRTPEEAEDDRGEDGDTRRVTYEGNAIDLTEGLAQNIVLALPMKHTCREDCRGLCPRCGKNLNEGDCACREQRTDPRLEGLRALLEQMKNN